MCKIPLKKWMEIHANLTTIKEDEWYNNNLELFAQDGKIKPFSDYTYIF